MILLLKEYFVVTDNEQIKSDSFTTIPKSLICYSRDALFPIWGMLERQLEQLSPETDSEIYIVLYTLAQFVFDLWLQFRGYD
jgi:hypothetical protein